LKGNGKYFGDAGESDGGFNHAGFRSRE
jgi:hypothetical protein